MEFAYRCGECGRRFEITPDLMLCPFCSTSRLPGQPLRGVLEVEMSGALPAGGMNSLAAGPHPWADLLPVEPEFFPPVPIESTPLWQPTRLRERLGYPHLYLKDDTRLPTGSLKDRASLLVAAFAKRHEIDTVVVASTGNAASSMAGIGAAAGLVVTVFVPAGAPRAKLVQSLQYGAQVELVDGTYDDAFEASLAFVRKHGGLCRNTGYNPMTIEGKKTVALEIVSGLGVAPDHVFVPAGDGVILGGVYKGFEDLARLGIIDAIPTVHAVQAEGSNAIARAFRCGADRVGFADDPSHRRGVQTIADSISVSIPANGYGAVRKLRSHEGRCVEVSDEAILSAQHELAQLTGLFAEPAAAASYAGFLASRARVRSHESVVLLITGTGLKDVESASREVGA
ncbi:MAG: threonine synthase [Spirochaetota bacterium]